MSRLALLGGKPIRRSPFPSWPVFDQAEESALLDVLRSGKWWRYAWSEPGEPDPGEGVQSGSKVAAFQESFAQFQGAKYGVASATGTGALEVALAALGIGPGDEVLVPAYTFVATASAVLMMNATPVFIDIDSETLNLDPKRLEEAVGPRTRAVILVHFAGLAADMGAIIEIARRRRLAVVEDAAHGHGGSWNGRGLGSIGDLGAFSFQASKNMTAGEGGLITTNDRELAALCESYISAGREPRRPWYEHHRLGWNYRMTEFQGAILLQQMRRLDAQNVRRNQSAAYLNEHLSRIPGISILRTPSYVTRHAHHLYAFRFCGNEFAISRDDFLNALSAEGIPCTGGYAHPLYQNPMFLPRNFIPPFCPKGCDHGREVVDFASYSSKCPNAELACHEVVWLEQRLLLSAEQDLGDIVHAIEKVHECRAEIMHWNEQTGGP